MVGWDSYRNRLRAEYDRFLLKTLSHNEESYLQTLNKGIDDILGASIDYIMGNYNALHSLDDDISMSDFNDVWFDNFSEQILITMLFRNRGLARRPVRKFYMGGSRIAHDELGLKQSFYNTDQQAVQILENYVDGLAESINNEYVRGVRKTVYDNRYDEPSVICDKLLGLSSVPIESKICVNNRCLYMVKTEYARCINTGLLQTYRNYGVRKCDWVTSGLRNVCDKCLDYEADSPYSLDEIEGLLPCHVNCCCSVKCHVPVNPSLQMGVGVVDLTPKK